MTCSCLISLKCDRFQYRDGQNTSRFFHLFKCAPHRVLHIVGAAQHRFPIIKNEKIVWRSAGHQKLIATANISK